MSQAILISDNEVINSLYEVNLRAYVATNVTIKRSLDDAMKLLEHAPNTDVVICFRELNSEDNAIERFQEFLNINELTIPVIVLGEPNTPINNSIIIKNKYDIKALLQSMAKILQITAKQMADLQVPKYFPIPIKLLSELKRSHCDIFFRRQKDDFEFEYFVIVEKDEPIEENLGKYTKDGVEHLYIDADERLMFINKTSSLVIGELERDDLTDSERVEVTQQGMGMVAQDFFESEEISETVASISRACIESIQMTIKEVPKFKNLLQMLVENEAEYCYKHSVITTFIASSIIDNISWGSEEQKSKVSFAIFFHDIFLVPIYRKYPDAISEEDLLFRAEVSDEDKNTVLAHAKLAGEMVSTFPRLPMGADTIIIQHHGMTNGQGFAVNFKDDISPLAKIIIVAEEITTNVLMNLEEKEDGTKAKISFNKAVLVEALNEKFRANSYRKIVDAFQEIKF